MEAQCGQVPAPFVSISTVRGDRPRFVNAARIQSTGFQYQDKDETAQDLYQE